MDSGIAKWRPTDDLLLIESVLEVNNLAVVHACVEFSCKFTLAEIEERWKLLLYDEVESKIAQEAILALPDSVVELIRSNSIWTRDEEDALSNILSTMEPSLVDFQALLDNDDIDSPWKPCRTPESLLHHWKLMKQYQLLKDQFCGKDDNLNNDNFINSSINTILTNALPDPLTYPQIHDEMNDIYDKINIWQSRFNQSLIEIGGHIPEYPVNNKNYAAILIGDNVSYFIKKTTVSIGRSTALHPVDIDLTYDGCSNDADKINCIIRYQDNGFKIMNLAKLPIMVNDRFLMSNSETNLQDSYVLKIGHSFLTFIDPKVHKAIVSNRPLFGDCTTLKAPTTQIVRKITKPVEPSKNLLLSTTIPQNSNALNTSKNNEDVSTSSQQPPPPLDANFPTINRMSSIGTTAAAQAPSCHITSQNKPATISSGNLNSKISGNCVALPTTTDTNNTQSINSNTKQSHHQPVHVKSEQIHSNPDLNSKTMLNSLITPSQLSSSIVKTESSKIIDAMDK